MMMSDKEMYEEIKNILEQAMKNNEKRVNELQCVDIKQAMIIYAESHLTKQAMRDTIKIGTRHVKIDNYDADDFVNEFEKQIDKTIITMMEVTPKKN